MLQNDGTRRFLGRPAEDAEEAQDKAVVRLCKVLLDVVPAPSDQTGEVSVRWRRGPGDGEGERVLRRALLDGVGGREEDGEEADDDEEEPRRPVRGLLHSTGPAPSCMALV